LGSIELEDAAYQARRGKPREILIEINILELSRLNMVIAAPVAADELRYIAFTQFI
jgi:hypothetical protein